MKKEGCTEEVKVDNPVRASSPVLEKEPNSEDFQVDHGRKEKDLLGEL